MVIRLDPLPSGARYEDQYGKWLEVFRSIAEARMEEEVVVWGCPAAWVPLMDWLGADVKTVRKHFPCDYDVLGLLLARKMDQRGPCDRSLLEQLCSMRPELVDALYKCDMEWDGPRLQARFAQTNEREFIVTCNGSFFRPEVIRFIDGSRAYVPEHSKVVLVPCAADKPYPAPLHDAVRSVIPADWYIAIVTGVLGVVPEALWPIMPRYDSGLPYEWRAMKQVRAYFERIKHERVVVYSDFYNDAIYEALAGMDDDERPEYAFVNPVPCPEYLDLRDPERLARLKEEVER